MDFVKKLRVCVKLELTTEDGHVISEDVLKLLYLIGQTGSILKAAKLLNIPYSTAWELIERTERVLGIKLVEKRRGGAQRGGTILTAEGFALVEYYRSKCRDLTVNVMSGTDVDLVYAGSHDIALERLIGLLREEKLNVDVYWIGSLRGLVAATLNEIDVAGMHILDLETGTFNKSIVKKVSEHDVVLIRGYKRLQGLILREELNVDEVFEKLLKGELRLVNRIRGTGTRRLVDYLLREYARKFRVPVEEIPKRVRGYDLEMRTHIEVARCVAQGLADVGVGVKCAAEMYKLKFIPLIWEDFDFVIPRERITREPVRKFIEKLKSREFLEILNSLPGYSYDSSIGQPLSVI